MSLAANSGQSAAQSDSPFGNRAAKCAVEPRAVDDVVGGGSQSEVLGERYDGIRILCRSLLGCESSLRPALSRNPHRFALCHQTLCSSAASLVLPLHPRVLPPHEHPHQPLVQIHPSQKRFTPTRYLPTQIDQLHPQPRPPTHSLLLLTHNTLEIHTPGQLKTGLKMCTPLQMIRDMAAPHSRSLDTQFSLPSLWSQQRRPLGVFPHVSRNVIDQDFCAKKAVVTLPREHQLINQLTHSVPVLVTPTCFLPSHTTLALH